MAYPIIGWMLRQQKNGMNVLLWNNRTPARREFPSFIPVIGFKSY
jgi:hypothetical protein